MAVGNSTNGDYFTVESHEGIFPEYISTQAIDSENLASLNPSSLQLLVYYYVQKESYQIAFEILEMMEKENNEDELLYVRIWKYFIFIRMSNIQESQAIREKIAIEGNLRELFLLMWRIADAKLLHFEGELDESQKAFTTLVEDTNISNYKFLNGYLLNQFAKVENDLGHIDQAIEYFNKAYDIFDQIDNNPQLLSVTINIGLCYQNLEEYELALKYYEKGSMLNNKNYRELTNAILICNIGLVYQQIGRLQQSETAMKQSLEFFESSGINYYLVILYQNLGRLYGQLGDFDTSLIYNEKAIALLNDYENILRRVEIMLNISVFFGYQKKFQQAEEKLREIETLLERNNLKTRRNMILVTYINLYLQKNDRTKAEPYFNELKENVEKSGINPKFKTLFEYTIGNYMLESLRFQEKAQGLELLNKIIDSNSSNYEMYTRALIKKCSVLLDEYNTTKLEEVITEIDDSLQELMNFSKEQNLTIIKIQSLFLLTEFEMLKGDIMSAQNFFIDAKKIAVDNEIDLYELYIESKQKEFKKLLSLETSDSADKSQVKDIGLKNLNYLLTTLLSVESNFMSKWRDPETDKFLNAVLHPIRYKIVKLLAHNGKMLRTELQNLIEIPQSSISRHLKTLEMEAIIINNFEFINSKVQSLIEITPYGLKQLRIFEES